MSRSVIRKILIPVVILGCILGTTAVMSENRETPAVSNEAVKTSFEALEKETRSRIGVYAVDTKAGKIISYREHERFPYCSTIKVCLAGEVLRSHSAEDMNRVIHYTDSDILSYAPVTKEHVQTGMSLNDLCEAAIRMSDNTAANLLLKELGGSQAFHQALHENLYDSVTNPVRSEPELNQAVPGEDRDTTTPCQMANNLMLYTVGSGLSSERRAQLVDWMTGNSITDTLIRAAVPETWTVSDKSGSGGYGTRNDIAFIRRPGQGPLILVVFTTHNDPNAKSDDQLVVKAAQTALSLLDPDYKPNK
jgi:beta-lactamase class A